MNTSPLNIIHDDVADAINAKKASMALWVTDAFYRVRPEYEARWGSVGRLRCTEDTEYHFSYLAEAVRFDYPELFLDYVAWGKIFLYSLRMPSKDLEENIEWMKAAVHRMMPEEIQSQVNPILDRALAQLPNMPHESSSFLKPGEPHCDLAVKWLQLLRARNTREARNLLLDAVKSGIPVTDIYQHVITPTLYEVGRLWQTRAINEAEEHFCSQTAETMLALLTSYFEVPKNRRTAVGFCVANEHHDLGIRVVMDCYSLHGWDSVCLGSNVPVRNMESIIRNWNPDVIAISATMAYHLPEVVASIKALRSAIGRQPRIIVGGRPFRICPDLWRKVGADGYAQTCAEAITSCN